MKPRGSGAELAADVEREACNDQDAHNSEQTGKRRGIGMLGIRKRSCWDSSWHRYRDKCARTPNDLKLSERGARRDGCKGEAKKEATDV